jgi:ABC-type multidrug transport system ATPase subunit
LEVDPVLVAALLQKHDKRMASGSMQFQLSGERMVVGRATGVDVLLVDPQVAYRHAELIRGNEGWRVNDLGSGRPTVLNGRAVSAAPIVEGDTLQIGPYRLTLADGCLSASTERRFSTLSVRQLSRQIEGQTLLDNVSFTVFSGEVVAVVGPSGSGKTTLLNAINGVAPADQGEVLLDGVSFHQQLADDRTVMGFVPQDDLVHAELTVEESLFYSGRLRLSSDSSDADVQEHVERVLDELDLSSIRESRIGDALKRGISGGQRKRVNLGQELMARQTRVLFLDEPTSGLDPRASQDIARRVRQLADRGRIVFLVTHDLTPEIMAQVDHMLVIAPGGRLAFFGPPEQACRWFGSSTPDGVFNRFSDRSSQQWAEDYRNSAAARRFVETREELISLEGVDRPPVRENKSSPSKLTHWRAQLARYGKIKLRDRTGIAVLAAQPPLLAAVMWIVFPKPTTALMFMVALSSLWFGMSASVRELIADRVIWLRERRIGVGVLPYLLSKVVVLGLMIGIQCISFTALLHWAVGMQDYGYGLVSLSAVATLTGMVGMSLGLLVSASWTSSEAAVGTLPLLLIPQITFSSIMVSVRSMGEVAQICSWFTVQRYAFDAVIKCGDELAYFKYGEWQRQRVLGFLYELGLKGTSGADDMGLSLIQLCAVMAAFTGLFLVCTAGLVWARGRRG